MLTASQRRTLRRLATSDAAEPHLARRAGWALDAADGDTDRTTERWLQRFLRLGVAGLEDAHRSGRPPQLSEETVRRVLMEPLFISSAKWTSRTVADAMGVSQATVVRLWARTFAPETLADAGSWRALDRNCRPTGVLLGIEGAVLVLERITTGRPAGRADQRPAQDRGAMRSPLRPSLQTVLAGRLVDVEGAAPETVPAFLRSAMPEPGARYVVVSDETAAGAVNAALAGDSPAVDRVRVPDHEWQALLPHLVVAVAPGARPALETLSHRVREWATSPVGGFCWTAARSSPETAPEPPPPDRSLVLAPTQRLAESITEAILDGLRTGRLRGGDHLTESYLMRTTHASRSQVREALRTLAMDGLIELRPGKGAIVPMPTGDDVLETYALRRAVGGVAMAGAAANWRPGQLGSLLQGMATLLETAATGDVRATDDADLDFQDVLAAASNLRRVLMTFRRLSLQLKLFTTVMGLKYAYSIDGIIADDSAILDAVRHRDTAEARRLWDQKMDSCVRYMLRQLDRAD